MIPSRARAKVTCRLVAGQKLVDIASAIERHLRRHPKGFGLEVYRHGPGSEALFVDPQLPGLAIAESALAELLGQAPLRGAIGAAFRRHLGREAFFLSF